MNARAILNVNCSGGEATCGAVTAAAQRHGVDVHRSEAPGDAARLAREAVAEGVERLIVAGGDGTVNEVVNGIEPNLSDVEIAVLPCGTGNDLARSLGIEATEAWADTMAVAAEGEAREADVARMRLDDRTERCVVNACSGGFAGDVKEQLTPERKERWGALAYWIAGAVQLTELDEYEMELTLDGVRQRGTMLQIAVSNGRTIGGGVPIAPDAVLNDGKLDLAIAPVQSTVDLVGALIALGFGRHSESENVVMHQAGEIEIRTDPRMVWSVDGEMLKPLERVSFEVMPNAIRLVAAEDAPAFMPATARGAAV
jgi:diacylglycerol kinase (ATP)